MLLVKRICNSHTRRWLTFFFEHIQDRIIVKRAWVVLEVWIRCEATCFTYTTVDRIIQAMLWGYVNLIGEIILHIMLSMPAFPKPINLALDSLWGVPDTAYKNVRCLTLQLGCSVLGWVDGIHVPTSQSFALPSPPYLTVCVVALLSSCPSFICLDDSLFTNSSVFVWDPDTLSCLIISPQWALSLFFL